MPVIIIVGAQWGDEGKGKVVDFLTEDAQLVIRFQGGNNAGHTVIVEDSKVALRLLPSGILRKNCRCLLASGVVIDPFALFDEIDNLKTTGIDVTPARFGIAPEAQLILPYHKSVDKERELELSENKIGTTGKGIGPAYETKVSRYGIRVIDLCHPEKLASLVQRNVKEQNAYLSKVLGSSEQFEASKITEDLLAIGERLKPYIANVSVEVSKAAKEGKFVVFEGAQGCLLDISHGTYPYVTSSNTISAYACVSAGVGPKVVDSVLGICKAYATRVGSGPFPTEDEGEAGETLRKIGKEFGTVTGRPRRCGWFDAVAVRRAARLNGMDSMLITKLDVLSGFKSVKLGTSYLLDGKVIDDVPPSVEDSERISVQYEEMPGWSEDITKVRTFNDLPQTTKNYLYRLAALTDCPIKGFSVGPERSQTVLLEKPLEPNAQ